MEDDHHHALLLLQEELVVPKKQRSGVGGTAVASQPTEKFLINFEVPAASETAAARTSSTNATTAPAATPAPTSDVTGNKKSQKSGGGGTFEDILSTVYGFTSSTKMSNRSLADMGKESERQLMDPLSAKICDWTSGKERNIRALIGSLSAVLWTDAAQHWKQPTMAELFAEENVKKHYRRACLVVHPDKQMGSVHEPLAKAIFTELNDAWTEFQKNGSGNY